jgi:hypothetical protein
VSESELTEFQRGVRTFYNHLMMRVANNFHGNPTIQVLCDRDNDLISDRAEEALESVLPEDYREWRQISELSSANMELQSKLRAVTEPIKLPENSLALESAGGKDLLFRFDEDGDLIGQIETEDNDFMLSPSDTEVLRNYLGGNQRAFNMLAICGVPKDRARTVENGIDVLATRYNKEIHFMRVEIDSLKRALVYACFAQHKTEKYMLPEGITLMDGDAVEVEFDGRKVRAGPYRRNVPSDFVAEEDLVQASVMPLNKEQHRSLIDESIPANIESKKRLMYIARYWESQLFGETMGAAKDDKDFIEKLDKLMEKFPEIEG